ncbi:MAG TPA: O-antigen ligase family protein [Gemmatimonadales bacterium]|nr:O-antigen ligase family protein [Gemmatimonadales bacterium]
MFCAAVLTIGLDQYRPFLGSVGNLSDVLFFAVFLADALTWLASLDQRRWHEFLGSLREMEWLLWGGVLLALGGAVASLQSEEPGASWRITFKYFAMACIWLPWVAIAIERYSSRDEARALYAIGFCLIAVATWTDLLIGTRFAGRFVTTPGYQVRFDNLSEALRYGGPTGHPNTLGYLSVFGALLCVSEIGASTGRRRVVAGLAGLAVCGGALIVSGSRGAIVGMAVGGVVLLAFTDRVVRRRVTTVSAVSLGLLVVALTIGGLKEIPSNPLRRLTESVQPRRDFDADWQRRRDLTMATKLLLRDPLTGYGMEDVDTPNPPTKVAFNLPHFVLLQSWVAGGALALFGAMWIYAGTLWVGLKAARRKLPGAAALFAICVAFALMDMVNPGLGQRLKWFALALVIATLRRAAHAPGPLDGRLSAANA